VQLYLATLQVKTQGYPELRPLIRDTMDSAKKLALIASQIKILKEMPNPDDSVELIIGVKNEINDLKNSDEIQDKQIELAFEGGEDFPLKASLSRAELSRILQNLVQNSAQASTNGSRIEVGVKKELNHAVISVRDHGHGVPKEIQNKIFCPDFTSKPGLGTGLGLAIVQHIAESRRGHVLLESTVGAGTLIQVKVPVLLQEGVAYGV
jgi:two-component system, NtrC family, nitrogen regulation sensor histidine kinase NtrY